MPEQTKIIRSVSSIFLKFLHFLESYLPDNEKFINITQLPQL